MQKDGEATPEVTEARETPQDVANVPSEEQAVPACALDKGGEAMEVVVEAQALQEDASTTTREHVAIVVEGPEEAQGEPAEAEAGTQEPEAPRSEEAMQVEEQEKEGPALAQVLVQKEVEDSTKRRSKRRKTS